MEKYVYKGKNKEELISLALNELGVTLNDVLINESEEKGGLFSGKKIVLEIVKLEDIASLGKKILEDLLKGFNINGNIEKKIREKTISYVIHSDNNNILIGKRGHILESIQTFIKHSINSQVGLYVNILVDIESYKEKQNYYLEKNAKRIARDVTLSKVPVKLDPMNSYERRIVHNAVSKFEYIESVSEGEEPNRCVVIKYKEKDKK